MDVCEEAGFKQHHDMMYGNSDNWSPVHLDKGSKIYTLVMENSKQHTGFFVSEDEYKEYLDEESNTFDVVRYCEDHQQAPYWPNGTYKNHISEFVVGEGGLDAAIATCENNRGYGNGGGEQLYIAEETWGEVQKNEDFISPVISEQDRYIGLENARRKVDGVVEDNMKSLGLEVRQPEESSETLKNVADQANLPETDHSNAQGNEQTQTRDNTQNL